MKKERCVHYHEKAPVESRCRTDSSVGYCIAEHPPQKKKTPNTLQSQMRQMKKIRKIKKMGDLI